MGTMDVALNVRRLREARGLTLEVLAGKAHVTKGFLSQVENFRALPSLPLLYELAQALEVDAAALMEASTQDAKHAFTPAGKGEVIEREFPESGFVYRALARAKKAKAMEPFLLDIPPRATRRKVTTNGDEFVYVLKGRVDFHLDQKIIPMEQGDCLYFQGEVPHFPHNPTGRKAQLLVVYSITH